MARHPGNRVADLWMGKGRMTKNVGKAQTLVGKQENIGMARILEKNNGYFSAPSQKNVVHTISFDAFG